jgi:hypothetical protein
MALDRDTFDQLMTESTASKGQLDRVVRQRVLQLKALQSVYGFSVPRPVAAGAPAGPAASARRAGTITDMIGSIDAPSARPAGEMTRLIQDLDGGAGAAPVATVPARPPAPRALLRASGGPVDTATFEVGEAGATLGRAPDNSIEIPDPQLSRHHARIDYRDGAYWLSDLRTTNGTLLNQTPIGAPAQLRSGDVITLGETNLIVRLQPG